jgi:hypothetical protein
VFMVGWLDICSSAPFALDVVFSQLVDIMLRLESGPRALGIPLREAVCLPGYKQFYVH